MKVSELDYRPEDIEKFGTRVVDIHKKDGSLKKKQTIAWIKPRGEQPFDVEDKLGEVKNWLSHLNRSVVYHNKHDYVGAKGKEKKAHEWCFRLSLSGEVNLSNEEIERLIRSNDKKRLFDYGNKAWPYVKDRFFKKDTDEQFVYLDTENKKVIETGIFSMLGVKENDLDKWIDWYNGTEKE